MTYERLLIERKIHVAYVTLNRPAALNALNAGLRLDLRHFFLEIMDDPDSRAVVMPGAGRAFCAGATRWYSS